MYYHYSHDAAGNRLSETTPVGATSYVYDAANRLTNVGEMVYTWDANGNLLSDGVKTYTYNRANRLTTLSGQETATSFAYNGLGDRVRQTVNGATTNYTLDINGSLAQVLADGTATYLYGLGRISQYKPTQTEYFLTDALGSLRQLVDASGNATLAKAYQPYGEVLRQTGSGLSSYGFAGEWRDSSGLVYLRARYYAPGLGRFTQRDPFPGHPNGPQSFNGYSYAMNNPVLYLDASGECPPCWLLPLLVALGVILVGTTACGPAPVGSATPTLPPTGTYTPTGTSTPTGTPTGTPVPGIVALFCGSDGQDITADGPDCEGNPDNPLHLGLYKNWATRRGYNYRFVNYPGSKKIQADDGHEELSKYGAGPNVPVVYIGFSAGGDSAVLAAEDGIKAGFAVEGLVLIDPALVATGVDMSQFNVKLQNLASGGVPVFVADVLLNSKGVFDGLSDIEGYDPKDVAPYENSVGNYKYYAPGSAVTHMGSDDDQEIFDLAWDWIYNR